MNRAELTIKQASILNHVADAGTLADVASVLIKYIYHISPGCYFDGVGGSPHEWVLRDISWIGIYMSLGRSRKGGKIILSLDHWPENLDGFTTLKISKGRKPSWSKVTLTKPHEISEALRVINLVHPKQKFNLQNHE